MDAYLKTLAAAGMALDAAEESLADGAVHGARDQLDEAGAALASLRDAWPIMAPAERTIVARMATPLRSRLDAVTARLPKTSALSEAPAEIDPEQDEEPEAA